MDARTRALGIAVLLGVAGAARADLVEKCAWSGATTVAPASVDTLCTPVVADLDGDCFADMVVVTYANDDWLTSGTLRAISGADCAELWSVARLGCRTCAGDAGCTPMEGLGTTAAFFPLSTPAVGDIDADGDLDVLAVLENGMRLAAFEADGTFKWCSRGNSSGFWAMEPAITDLDGDGLAEIVLRERIVRSDGSLAASLAFPFLQDAVSTVADLDGDDRPEILTSYGAFRANGSLLWAGGSGASTRVAADLDGDGGREVIGSLSDALEIRDGATGLVLATAPLPGTGACFGFPLHGGASVGDLDGDGRPEIVVASSELLVALHLTGDLGAGTATLTTAWQRPVEDCSSGVATSALFDADGDGLIDVVHADEHRVRILRGFDGALLRSAPNESATWTEGPVPVDLDFDGHAEIVVPASPVGPGGGGVRVLHDPVQALASARSIWNQHDFRASAVGTDGSIPATEEDSAAALSTHRVQPGDPDISGARPSIAELWPPNHAWTFVSVEGLPWPVTIVGVSQDEPVDDLGDGTTGPDARLADGGAWLRAERSGNRDGRVYSLCFEVAVDRCRSIPGVVTACVPHDRRPGHACVDQGPLFDATAQ